jgi:isoaspartyl peptidase/L-asparaginase-like protein (Ntn-hydrolase superfamily)
MTDLGRRDFLKLGAAALAASSVRETQAAEKKVLAIATWPHGLAAVKLAAQVLAEGGSALDAAEKGVNVVEDDPQVTSVGRGGYPNSEGVLELDAAVMRGGDRMIGAVASLRKIGRPVSVARAVLEKTNHVLLVGEGALAFARAQGFQEEELLTPGAKAAWEEWKARKAGGAPPKKGEHDTIGLLALDKTGELAAALSTSGLAWKLPGRVGDSPIPGAGYYADSRVGAAAATGVGEEVLRISGSFLVVEGMRRGLEPLRAIEEALERIRQNAPRVPNDHGRMVGFIAMRKDGAFAGASLGRGFQIAVAEPGSEPRLVDAPSLW